MIEGEGTMTNQSKRGGMKQGAGSGEQKKHQGVHPGSTVSKKKGGNKEESHQRIIPKKDK